MGSFNFLVFDGVDFDNYEEYQTEEKNLLEDICKALNREDVGCSTNTSMWMNRFAALKNEDRAYVLVPSTIPSHYDIVKATTGKYAVFIVNKGELTSFTKDDIEYFKENLPKKFDIKEREKQKEEIELQYTKAILRDTFRLPIMLCSDDTIEILRFLIINNIEELYIPLVIAGIENDDESLQQLYRYINNDSRFPEITINPEAFVFEIKSFFFPQLQFDPLGLTAEEGAIVYFSLCSENE